MKASVGCRGGIAVVGLALGLAGCLRGSSGPAASPEELATRKQATSYARSTTQDVYRSLRRGSIDTSQSLLASDALVVGPRPGDVFVGRSDAVVAATTALGVGDRQKTRSRGLVAEGSITGRSAWVVDRIEVDRRPYSVVAVLAEIDEIWYVLALHVASARPGRAGDGLAPLPGGVGAGAAPVVELARTGGQSPRAFVDQLSRHKKTTVLGMGRSDHLRGKRKIERAWKRKRNAPAPFRFDGDVRAAVTPDGGLAWVIGNTKSAEGTSQRAMLVYEQINGAWRLVALQSTAPFR